MDLDQDHQDLFYIQKKELDPRSVLDQPRKIDHDQKTFQNLKMERIKSSKGNLATILEYQPNYGCNGCDL